jgi:nucleoside 2-deoxyribosyltransferase
MPFADCKNLPEVWEDVIRTNIFGESALQKWYRCMRADDIYDNTSIIDDIVRLISEADIIIADLTTRNPNVMYELGYAHALGKECIPITQSMGDVPFDLRHRRVIPYQTSRRGLEELEDKLINTLLTIDARLNSQSK